MNYWKPFLRVLDSKKVDQLAGLDMWVKEEDQDRIVPLDFLDVGEVVVLLGVIPEYSYSDSTNPVGDFPEEHEVTAAFYSASSEMEQENDGRERVNFYFKVLRRNGQVVVAPHLLFAPEFVEA